MPQTKRQTLDYTLILTHRSASFQSSKLFYYRKSPTRDHTESPHKPCANNHALTARQALQQGTALWASRGNTSSAQGTAWAWLRITLTFPCVIPSPPPSFLLPSTCQWGPFIFYSALGLLTGLFMGAALSDPALRVHTPLHPCGSIKSLHRFQQSPTGVVAWPNQLLPRK